MANQFKWTPLPFGKHAGKTLPQVAIVDPNWLFWAVDEISFYGRLADEVAEIAYKASHIKIREPDPENWRVEYRFALQNTLAYTFANFYIISAREAESCCSPSIISTHLDLSFPRRLKNRRKLDYVMMLQQFKYLYFYKRELNKALCECFFLNDRNFLPFLRSDRAEVESDSTLTAFFSTT